MSVYHTNLCVGGPLDGQQYISPDNRQNFCVPLLKPLELAVLLGVDGEMTTTTVEYVIYSRMLLHTSDHQLVTLWAADTETYFSVFMRLLNAYERRRDLAKRAEKLLRETGIDAPLTAGDYGKPGLQAQIDRLRAFLAEFITQGGR